jgi:hypothetical protein
MSIIVSLILPGQEQKKEIPITILIYEPRGISETELLKILSTTKDALVKTGLFRGFDAPHNELIWERKPMKLLYDYSIEKGADFLLSISPEKMGNFISSETKLINLSTMETVDTFKESWAAEPLALNHAIENLTLEVAFKSTGEVKVNFAIESNPNNCDVFRDNARLGNTGQSGIFSGTYWWEKGRYIIKVCRSEYKDWKEECLVEDNPTDYQKKANLEGKQPS